MLARLSLPRCCSVRSPALARNACSVGHFDAVSLNGGGNVTSVMVRLKA